MKEIVLAVFFVLNGEPTILADGWQPIVQPDMETCETRAGFIRHYMIEQEIAKKMGATDYIILCGTTDEILAEILEDEEEG